MCRVVAETLDSRRAVVADRPRPVVAMHHDGVWKGRAATASRARLHRVIGATLYSLSRDLATTVRALLDEASRLDTEAAALQRRAQIQAAAEARARAEADAQSRAEAGAQARAKAAADSRSTSKTAAARPS